LKTAQKRFPWHSKKMALMPAKALLMFVFNVVDLEVKKTDKCDTS